MRIAFRTKGNHPQGMGDVWGCIALAEECIRSADEVLFIIPEGEEAVEAIQGQGFLPQVIRSSAEESQALRAFHPEVVVVNQLNNPAAYIQSLRNFARWVVTMEDVGEGARYADLRINVLYDAPDSVTGTEYVALRREFQALHEQPKFIRNEIQELVITQGGSDTRGFTPKILSALEQLHLRPHCTVVTGPAFRHERELKRALAASTLDITLFHNTREMATFLYQADLAITAAGITLFECACVGTPAVMVCAEPFEVETASRMARNGTAVNLGFGGELDPAKLAETVNSLALNSQERSRLSQSGKEQVDGRGSERILRLMKDRVAAESGCRR